LDDGWVMQLNIYRWLMARTVIPDEVRSGLRRWGVEVDSETYPVPEKVYIQAIAMQELPRTGMEYWPQRSKDGYQIDDVPLFPMDEIEDRIRPYAREWHRYLVEGAYPPVVPEEDKWLCNFCAFNGERYEGAPCFPTRERMDQAWVDYHQPDPGPDGGT
jgi:hypothetical protein